MILPNKGKIINLNAENDLKRNIQSIKSKPRSPLNELLFEGGHNLKAAAEKQRNYSLHFTTIDTPSKS